MPVPSKDEILAFIQSAGDRVGKREIARAFNIRGADRIDLKRVLREMADEGLISGGRKRYRQPGTLPPVGVVDIVTLSADGDLIAVPLAWEDEDTPPPRLRIVDEGKRVYAPPLGVGDRLLARMEAVADAQEDEPPYLAKPIRRLDREQQLLLGIFRAVGTGGRIDPVDRKALREWPVRGGDTGEARDGELVRFRVTKQGRYGLAHARVIERLGSPEDQHAVSLIAIHAHGLRHAFPAAVLAEPETLSPPTLAGREDLRDTPLVTIDPPDARDHDDAVWAAPDPDPGNQGGWQVIVAIADVAHYVRLGSELDREALRRGNSAYFPDRVLPMLPEEISNDLCSLKEGVDRPCLAVHMAFDRRGRKKGHRFTRALMRSHGRLSYEQVQAAVDGRVDDATAPLLEPVLRPLFAAYGALAEAREDRQPLELDLPERKIELDDEGHVAAIRLPERLDAHRLIEEFMIQANVAAAETLEARRSPIIYRVHEPPSAEKRMALADFLATLDIGFPKAGTVRPHHFNRVLATVAGGDLSELVNDVVLRSQSQAEYSAANAGHFGLNLRRYAHFTSPIRRYADLMVHRALISALDLGAGGLGPITGEELDRIAAGISETERRAMSAERETSDRLLAAYLADRVGSRFLARISGVTRSGLFVRLVETGADGFVPIATIGEEFFTHDETRHAIIGETSGEAFRLGDRVEVRLAEAIPSAGALRFEMLSKGRFDLGRPRARGRPERFGRQPRRGKLKRRRR